MVPDDCLSVCGKWVDIVLTGENLVKEGCEGVEDVGGQNVVQIMDPATYFVIDFVEL